MESILTDDDNQRSPSLSPLKINKILSKENNRERERGIFTVTIYNLIAHLLSDVMLLFLAANKNSSFLSIKEINF